MSGPARIRSAARPVTHDVTGFFFRTAAAGSGRHNAGVHRRLQRALLSAAAGGVLLLAGCGFWRPAKIPMDTRLEPSACAARADTLVVFLPGAYSKPDEFVREGFVEALRRRRIAADAMLVDAHLGYYDNRSIAERLDADVIAPAHARGYLAVWLVGISIGGLGALAHEATRPGGVAGIVVLAPYLAGLAVAPAAERPAFMPGASAA